MFYILLENGTVLSYPYFYSIRDAQIFLAQHINELYGAQVIDEYDKQQLDPLNQLQQRIQQQQMQQLQKQRGYQRSVIPRAQQRPLFNPGRTTILSSRRRKQQ